MTTTPAHDDLGPDTSSAAVGAGAPQNPGSVHTDYLVEGMTCGHCVSSVTEEVSDVDGVDSVSVELNVGGSSRVTVVSSRPVSEDSIRAAVTEAGYSVVDAR